MKKTNKKALLWVRGVVRKAKEDSHITNDFQVMIKKLYKKHIEVLGIKTLPFEELYSSQCRSPCKKKRRKIRIERMGQVHIFLFIKSSADTMIQRYQHCSRLAVKALVAALRCTVLIICILFAA